MGVSGPDPAAVKCGLCHGVIHPGQRRHDPSLNHMLPQEIHEGRSGSRIVHLYPADCVRHLRNEIEALQGMRASIAGDLQEAHRLIEELRTRQALIG